MINSYNKYNVSIYQHNKILKMKYYIQVTMHHDKFL